MAFKVLGVAALAFYLLWVIFLAVMALARAKMEGKLTKAAVVLGTPVLIVGFVLDVALNVLVMTPIMLELPREATVSERLKRHNQTSTGWRKKIAQLVEPILDPFDPEGNHI